MSTSLLRMATVTALSIPSLGCMVQVTNQDGSGDENVCLSFSPEPVTGPPVRYVGQGSTSAPFTFVGFNTQVLAMNCNNAADRDEMLVEFSLADIGQIRRLVWNGNQLVDLGPASVLDVLEDELRPSKE